MLNLDQAKDFAKIVWKETGQHLLADTNSKHPGLQGIDIKTHGMAGTLSGKSVSLNMFWTSFRPPNFPDLMLVI